MPLVTVVGRWPPPIGGVTRSIDNLCASLRAHGVDVCAVDYSRPARGASALARARARRPALVIVNFSLLHRFHQLRHVPALLRAPTVAYLHGASFVADWHAADPVTRNRAVRALGRYSEVWVNNDDVDALVRDELGHPCVQVVSPSSTTTETAGERPARTGRRAAVFAAHGKPIYGADVAIDAVAEVRDRTGLDWRLTLVTYGDLTEDGSDLVRRADALPWVEHRHDLSPDQVDVLLGGTDLVLRPSSTDGDSLVLREALACGARVLASDVVARPAGVETCPPTAAAVSAAILNGGTVSPTGALGQPVDLVTLSRFVAPDVSPHISTGR